MKHVTRANFEGSGVRTCRVSRPAYSKRWNWPGVEEVGTWRVTASDGSVLHLDPAEAGKSFAHIIEDGQSRFFKAFAEAWQQPGRDGHLKAYLIGGHIKNCGCGGDAARDMLKEIAFWAEHSEADKKTHDENGVVHASNEPTEFLRDLQEFRQMRESQKKRCCVLAADKKVFKADGEDRVTITWNIGRPVDLKINDHTLSNNPHQDGVLLTWNRPEELRLEIDADPEFFGRLDLEAT